MKSYLECWIASAKALFSQALAGEPRLAEIELKTPELSGDAYQIDFSGSLTGHFIVILDSQITASPLLGEGVDQVTAWAEFLREVAEAAAGELLAATGQSCRVVGCRRAVPGTAVTCALHLSTRNKSWTVLIQDELRNDLGELEVRVDARVDESEEVQKHSGSDLFLDVELEAALRFGCCEMPLGEILELGPGDVVELDRLITDPVDLIVGDKIVAQGEVVLVNGNFGLRVTEVATPQRQLESIRCLF